MSDATPISVGPILAVEDCDEDFDTLRQALRRAGRREEPVRALDGDECLDLLERRRRDGGLPRLILMDLNTPGNDGRDALRAIKADPVLRAIPVVIFTTSSNPRDIQSCRAAGADAYHIKPFGFSEHMDLLERIFWLWLDSPPSEEESP